VSPASTTRTRPSCPTSALTCLPNNGVEQPVSVSTAVSTTKRSGATAMITRPLLEKVMGTSANAPRAALALPTLMRGTVGVGVTVGVPVFVGVPVKVTVRLGVGVTVPVSVGLDVRVFVAVPVAVGVGE